MKRLRAYALQLKLWAEIAGEGVKNRQSLAEIRERIIAKDKVTGKFTVFFKAQPSCRKLCSKITCRVLSILLKSLNLDSVQNCFIFSFSFLFGGENLWAKEKGGIRKIRFLLKK